MTSTIAHALRDATDTDAVVIAEGAVASVGEVFARTFGDRAAIVIADENTLRVAGDAVTRALEEGGASDTVEPYVFPGRPTLHADYENIAALVPALRAHQAIPVALGSGTINDIVKRATFECDRPYMTVATAASMDGYASFGASITNDGFKHTMECSAPRAVVADVGILMDAPPDMTSSGYGDLLAKITAGADWIIADALEIEPIKQKEWSLVQGPLRAATGRPAELRAADPSAMHAMIEGLIMSGLAMQAASSSRPASGAEHQFSHLWEMEGLGQDPPNGQPPLSHGFKVALGTVSIAALYERILDRDLAALDIDAAVRTWPSWDEVERRVRAAHGPPVEDAAVRECRAKYIDGDTLARRLTLLRERWPELRERLRAQLIPARQVRVQLQQAGCPTTPAQIGLELDRLEQTYRRAQTIRRRYTVLDLANETGLLDECVEELFASDGFWGPTATARA